MVEAVAEQFWAVVASGIRSGEDVASGRAGVAQPGADHSAADAKDSSDDSVVERGVGWGGDSGGDAPRAADTIVASMRAHWAAYLGDEDVSNIWKHLRALLFKTVIVPSAADVWRAIGRDAPARDKPV